MLSFDDNQSKLLPQDQLWVQHIVTQSQEADDRDNARAHDIARERNALDTEVRNDGTDNMVGKTSLSIK